MFNTSFSEGKLRDKLANKKSRNGYNCSKNAPNALGCRYVLCSRYFDSYSDRIIPVLILVFDQVGTFVTMIGYSVPPFFTSICDRNFFS